MAAKSFNNVGEFLRKWEEKHDHVDPDYRVMILRDLCDVLRHFSATAESLSPAEHTKIAQLLSQRFTGLECIRDVQSEAIRTADAYLPIASAGAVAAFSAEVAKAGALTAAGSYVANRLVRAEYVPLLRENACIVLRMAIRRMTTLVADGKATEAVAAGFVASIIDPFLKAISAADASEPAKRDFYEVIQPLLVAFAPSATADTSSSSANAASSSSASASVITQLQTAAIYESVRANWRCETAHLFTQLAAVNAALFPLFGTDAFKSALDTLLTDLTGAAANASSSTSEDFGRNLSAFIAVIRSSSGRVGDKVPQLFAILEAELARLSSEAAAAASGTGEEASAASDEARASILDSLRALVRDCPAEAEPYFNRIVAAAVGLVSYDPNFCGDDDTAGAADNNADDNAYGSYGNDGGDDYADYYAEEGGGDAYDYYDAAGGDQQGGSDDFSWKARLSAAALLAAVLRTRAGAPVAFEQLLGASSASTPLLIKRLGDRVEAVRLEVHDLLTTALEYASAERIVAATTNASSSSGADQQQQQTNMSIAFGRETSTAVAPRYPQAGAIVAAMGPTIAALCAEADPAAKGSSPKIAAKAVEVLRRLVLVLDASAVAAAAPTAAAAKAVFATESTRRDASSAGVAAPLLHVLRYLLVRSAAADVEATGGPAAAASVLSLLPLVAEAAKDKSPQTAKAAVDLAAEMAVVSPTVAPVVINAVASLISASDAELKLAAIGAISRVATSPLSRQQQLPESALAEAFASLALLLDADATRRAAAVTIRSLVSAPSLTADAVASFAERLCRLTSRADRQEREAVIAALEALVSRHPADVPQSAYASLLASLAEHPQTSTLFAERELGIGALSAQLLAAIAISGNASATPAAVAPAAARLLEYISLPTVQGLPIVEAGRAFFFIGNASSGADFASLLEGTQAAFLGDARGGSTAVAFGAVVAADRDADRRAGRVSQLASSVAVPAAGARAADALGEFGRFADITAFPSAVAALTAGAFPTEDVAIAVTGALAKASSSVQHGAATLSLLLTNGVDGSNYVATRALRASLSEGALCPAQHPLRGPAVFAAALERLTSDAVISGAAAATDGAAEAVPEAYEALGQLAAWDAPKTIAAITALTNSGTDAGLAAAAYALRFALRAAPRSLVPFAVSDAAGSDSPLVAACLGVLKHFGRPGRAAVRRNCLLLLRSLLAEGRYSQAVHALAFAAAAAELTVDASLVRLTDLGIVKHREDRGVDLRRNAFDLIRDLLASPAEAALLSADDCAAIATGTIAALGPIAGAASEDDEDIMATARRLLVALAKVPAAWAAVASAEGVASLGKYTAATLKLREKDGVAVDKKEEDNVVLALALLFFVKSRIPADRLAGTPLADKIREAEGNPRASRGRLLLASELLA